jgi:TonB-linked SusC/RagA family outer membrane protein
MRQTCIFFLFLFLATAATAQTRISGRAVDKSDGTALIGATVREKGTPNAVNTDTDGRFVLTVSKPDATISLNYIGYADMEVPLAGRSELLLELNASDNLIDEVVVVGYGTQRKSDLTGAIGTVKAKDIERIPTASVEQALQGKIAGVYVSPASGEPGQGATIRIRGTGTFNNAGPLYVVDGMLLDDAAFVNPQDVASIEVLKDASATAIYGNRGANGVIMITTKRGIAGRKAQFTAGTYYGTQKIARTLPMLNASEFAQMYNELRGNPPAYPDPDALGAGTDWQDVIYRDAPIANAQLGVSGIWKKLNYNLSGNYFNQQGILDQTGFDRYTGRFNGEYPVLSNVTIGTNLALSREKRNTVGGNVIGGAYRIPPLFSVRDSAGNFSDPTAFGQSIGNPAADIFYKNDQNARVNRLVGTTYATWSFFKNFRFKTSFGFDDRDEYYYNFEPVFMVTTAQLNKEERRTTDTTNIRTWLWENTLSYDKVWDALRLNVLLGQTAQEYNFEKVNIVNGILQPNGEILRDWAMQSFLFRANAVLFDRFLLTTSLRADGSSRFSRNNRWGYFPSVAVGWNITQEPFLQGQRVFDRLKLRSSWGITGNDKIQDYPSLGIISENLNGAFNDTIQPGATLTNYANADIRWETTEQLDFGIEMAVLDGRLTAELDWYRRYTYDILSDLPIPEYVGSGANPFVNAAQVENVGWDITLQWREKRGKISYNLGLIASPVRNKVLAINQGKSEIFAGRTGQNDFATRTVIGQPIGSFYGYKVAGVFQNAAEIADSPSFGTEKPGDFRFADLNSDGVLDAQDRTDLGSPIPTLTYGFNAGVECFGFDIAADFFGVKGNKVVNAKTVARFDTPNWERLWYDGRWTGEGSSNTVPRASNGGHNYRMSDFLIEDGAFFRLRSVALGYTLPTRWTRQIGVQRLRIYGSGTNLWTKQAYSGFTPEFPNGNVFEAGIDYLNYPMSKTYLFGLDLAF